VYVISPAGPERDRILGALNGEPKGVFDTVQDFLNATEHAVEDPTQPPGPLGANPLFPPPPTRPAMGEVGPANMVFVGPGVPSGDTLQLATTVAQWEGNWIPVVLEEGTGSGPPVARPMSMGYPLFLDDLVAEAADTGRPVLELRTVLQFISRARHDINNPLTSGLAETQLLLMDVEEVELRESLEVIQDQLRRIRDLVASLSVLRQPSA